MTAPLRLSFADSDHVSLSQDATCDRKSQMSYTKIIEPRGFRMRFAIYWSEFLKENYRNPEEVAVDFGVRYQTSLNWWQGLNRPSGDVVALAFIRHPEKMATYMREQR